MFKFIVKVAKAFILIFIIGSIVVVPFKYKFKYRDFIWSEVNSSRNIYYHSLMEDIDDFEDDTINHIHNPVHNHALNTIKSNFNNNFKNITNKKEVLSRLDTSLIYKKINRTKSDSFFMMAFYPNKEKNKNYFIYFDDEVNSYESYIHEYLHAIEHFSIYEPDSIKENSLNNLSSFFTNKRKEFLYLGNDSIYYNKFTLDTIVDLFNDSYMNNYEYYFDTSELYVRLFFLKRDIIRFKYDDDCPIPMVCDNREVNRVSVADLYEYLFSYSNDVGYIYLLNAEYGCYLPYIKYYDEEIIQCLNYLY